ncbi:MAG: aspartyl protease family protein [Deltaproteobacteria bacterium]|nr:aspartyl protease family protein [Deltaproteobacteria bacterium]
MICPKCGFSQPDDIYCALCGVNIGKYTQAKRKRQRKIGILVGCVAVFGLAVVYLLSSPLGKSPLIETTNTTPIGSGTSSSINAISSHGEGLPVQNRASSPRPRSAVEPASTRQSPRPASVQQDNRKALSDQTHDQGPASAQEWFEKGKSLDDDSEAEIECYRKAKQLDPKFAPAAFRLGAIYFRQAKYELADQEFADFLKYASDRDKETYNIYEYYSLADVERLAEAISEQGKAEEGQGQPPEKEQAPSESQQGPSESEGELGTKEASEEVMTMVDFSRVDGHILVPVVLNDEVEAHVLVDTGAGITVLSTPLADDLGLDVAHGHAVTLKTMAVDVQAQLARLDSLRVGRFSRHDFPVAVTALPSLDGKTPLQGILGMDFMSHYTIHIDSERSKIVLTPRPADSHF